MVKGYQTMPTMNFTDLTKIIDLLTHSDVKDVNDKLKELSDLNNFLAQLNTTERAIILKKIKLFAQSDAKTVPYDSSSNKYSPEYLKMDFVHCDFTGVGFEWDGPHYALIWDIDPKFDSVMVIPSTSKQRKELPGVFSVGQISGLPHGKKTTLLVSDMTRVSRKRLSPLYFNHPKKGQKPVRLATAWMKRIQEAVAVSYANERTFEQILMNNCGVAMVNDLKTLKDWRYKPVKATYDPSTLTLKVRLWNEDKFYNFELKKPKTIITKETKIKLIKDLFSQETHIKNAAEIKYLDLYED